MNETLSQLKKEVYDKCGLKMANLKIEHESRDYDACQFELNGFQIISRTAKKTPKKSGQFVTFWKRIGNGPIEPFDDKDRIGFYIVNICTSARLGQFVFPKSLLVKKGILSTGIKEGKRAFRVYPSWDETTSNQAKLTQKWQLNYFYEITPEMDFRTVLDLYGVL
ncbi:MepB family protein [Cyclobacterium qasimii]|uniref:MepB family protein n=2 Tax=Cyclobacterium qasimii TaxID=1350429 RepID=S7WNA9_9BACT|nr:MepB family protein [Cyclobacterium qasimii]EPR65668.1 hypothetical protein ADICYQ_5303 [Cyclobacterium qasimii M12-11B]GEO23549.1 hypothetical protein CQA01_40830 [Cyclobacterium qasimii]